MLLWLSFLLLHLFNLLFKFFSNSICKDKHSQIKHIETNIVINLFHLVLYFFSPNWGTFMVVIIWKLDWQLPVQSGPITTKDASSNPVHGEVYSIQHYVIKFVSDLPMVGFFSPGTPPSSTTKTSRHDIAEILLKVVLNTK